MESPHDWYPEKPLLEKVKVEGNWGLTLFSVLLFVLTFLYVFQDQLDFVFYLVLVLLIHEGGHYLSMKYFRYENLRMLFIPLMGAFVQGSKSRYSQKESLLVIAAGPFPGVWIGIALFIIAQLQQQVWLLEFSFLFLFLNVMNLIPIDPLDGGQLFKLYVKRKRDLFLMVFALLSSLLLIVVGYFLSNYILMAFGFFMAFKVRSLQRNYYLRKQLDAAHIEYELNYEELSNRDYAHIKRILLQEMPTLRKLAELNGEDADELVASHVNAVLSTPLDRDAPLNLRVFIFIFWLLSIAVPVFLFTGSLFDFSWYFETL
ncbi:MAG: hypothetical protein RLZZ301_819 [Bacteroidota bacterium]|jgi:membrane-associated protease RseP (regulator of RpoE activity)